MSNKLVVIPEELKSAGTDFFSIRGEIGEITQQMMQVVNDMISVFSGEASTAYRSKFDALEPDMTKIQNMIQEHSTDLQQMASEYATAESTSVETSNALKGSVIS